MNNTALLAEVSTLKVQVEALQNELKDTKERLKNYTAPKRSKLFYQNHKEEIKQNVKAYRERTDYAANISAEKKKEYNRIAYLNRKDRLQTEKDSTENQ